MTGKVFAKSIELPSIENNRYLGPVSKGRWTQVREVSSLLFATVAAVGAVSLLIILAAPAAVHAICYNALLIGTLYGEVLHLALEIGDFLRRNNHHPFKMLKGLNREVSSIEAQCVLERAQSLKSKELKDLKTDIEALDKKLEKASKHLLKVKCVKILETDPIFLYFMSNVDNPSKGTAIFLTPKKKVPEHSADPIKSASDSLSLPPFNGDPVTPTKAVDRFLWISPIFLRGGDTLNAMFRDTPPQEKKSVQEIPLSFSLEDPSLNTASDLDLFDNSKWPISPPSERKPLYAKRKEVIKAPLSDDDLFRLFKNDDSSTNESPIALNQNHFIWSKGNGAFSFCSSTQNYEVYSIELDASNPGDTEFLNEFKKRCGFDSLSKEASPSITIDTTTSGDTEFLNEFKKRCGIDSLSKEDSTSFAIDTTTSQDTEFIKRFKKHYGIDSTFMENTASFAKDETPTNLEFVYQGDISFKNPEITPLDQPWNSTSLMQNIENQIVLANLKLNFDEVKEPIIPGLEPVEEKSDGFTFIDLSSHPLAEPLEKEATPQDHRSGSSNSDQSVPEGTPLAASVLMTPKNASPMTPLYTKKWQQSQKSPGSILTNLQKVVKGLSSSISLLRTKKKTTEGSLPKPLEFSDDLNK